MAIHTLNEKVKFTRPPGPGFLYWNVEGQGEGFDLLRKRIQESAALFGSFPLRFGYFGSDQNARVEFLPFNCIRGPDSPAYPYRGPWEPFGFGLSAEFTLNAINPQFFPMELRTGLLLELNIAGRNFGVSDLSTLPIFNDIWWGNLAGPEGLLDGQGTHFNVFGSSPAVVELLLALSDNGYETIDGKPAQQWLSENLLSGFKLYDDVAERWNPDDVVGERPILSATGRRARSMMQSAQRFIDGSMLPVTERGEVESGYTGSGEPYPIGSGRVTRLTGESEYVWPGWAVVPANAYAGKPFYRGGEFFYQLPGESGSHPNAEYQDYPDPPYNTPFPPGQRTRTVYDRASLDLPYASSWNAALDEPVRVRISRFGRTLTWSNMWKDFVYGPDQVIEGRDVYVDRPGLSFANNDVYGRSAADYLKRDLPYNLRVKFHLVDDFEVWFAVTMRITDVVIGITPGSLLRAVYAGNNIENQFRPYFAPSEKLMLSRAWYQLGHVGCIRDFNVADVVETSPAYDKDGVDLNWRQWYGCLVTMDKPGLDTDDFELNAWARVESDVQRQGDYNPAVNRAPFNPEDVNLRVRTDTRIAAGVFCEYRGRRYKVKTVSTVDNDRYMLVSLGLVRAETVLNYPTPSFGYTGAVYGDALADIAPSL